MASRELTGQVSTVEFETCSDLSTAGLVVVGLSANGKTQGIAITNYFSNLFTRILTHKTTHRLLQHSCCH